MLSRAAEYPAPWYGWRVTQSNATQLVIDSATAWCEFAVQYAGIDNAINWSAIVSDYYSIRITPKAVASIDCFEFEHAGIRVPAVYWGVETTVWLDGSKLDVERVNLLIEGDG